MNRMKISKVDINDVIHLSFKKIKNGVGPWKGNWPKESHFDAELLRVGDERNVIDKYRYWKMQNIKQDLDHSRHQFHVAIENWEHDSNIGSIVRTANAFNCSKVHIVGLKHWNRRGAMVTDRYQHLEYHQDFSSLLSWSDRNTIPIIGIDNVPGSVSLRKTVLPSTCILLFGQENVGLSSLARQNLGSGNIRHIDQFGSTRSINAGAAAAIAMYSWISQHAQ